MVRALSPVARALLPVSRIIDIFTEWTGRIGLWLVPIVTLIGVYNVGARYIGRFIGQNLSSNMFIELQWYLFSLIFLIASGYVLKHDGHVRVDVLYSRYSPTRKAWINLICTLLMLFPFCFLLIYFSWGPVSFSWEIGEVSGDPGGLPRYPLKTFIIISPILLIVQGTSEAIKNLAYLTGDAMLPEAEHEEVL